MGSRYSYLHCVFCLLTALMITDILSIMSLKVKCVKIGTKLALFSEKSLSCQVALHSAWKAMTQHMTRNNTGVTQRSDQCTLYESFSSSAIGNTRSHHNIKSLFFKKIRKSKVKAEITIVGAECST